MPCVRLRDYAVAYVHNLDGSLIVQPAQVTRHSTSNLFESSELANTSEHNESQSDFISKRRNLPIYSPSKSMINLRDMSPSALRDHEVLTDQLDRPTRKNRSCWGDPQPNWKLKQEWEQTSGTKIFHPSTMLSGNHMFESSLQVARADLAVTPQSTRTPQPLATSSSASRLSRFTPSIPSSQSAMSQMATINRKQQLGFHHDALDRVSPSVRNKHQDVQPQTVWSPNKMTPKRATSNMQSITPTGAAASAITRRRIRPKSTHCYDSPIHLQLSLRTKTSISIIVWLHQSSENLRKSSDNLGLPSTGENEKEPTRTRSISSLRGGNSLEAYGTFDVDQHQNVSSLTHSRLLARSAGNVSLLGRDKDETPASRLQNTIDMLKKARRVERYHPRHRAARNQTSEESDSNGSDASPLNQSISRRLVSSNNSEDMVGPDLGSDDSPRSSLNSYEWNALLEEGAACQQLVRHVQDCFEQLQVEESSMTSEQKRVMMAHIEKMTQKMLEKLIPGTRSPSSLEDTNGNGYTPIKNPQTCGAMKTSLLH
ncbi:unnamed protein product [Angiostrongylus costaricensis]|uniref:Protein kinase domain-containing protein n=1 Tax=Angiostrongylus costaricensis TaxID=334426 RepID=A0A158PDF7_ANGCS|nr:unnamed protein product [Angiostrongylus costaricensis]